MSSKKQGDEKPFEIPFSGVALSVLAFVFILILFTISPSMIYSQVLADNDSRKIVTDVRMQRIEFVVSLDQPVEICGVTDNFDLNILLRNYRFVLYDDGSSRTTSSTYVSYLDSHDVVVASSPQTQIRNDNGFNQFNVVMNCIAAENDKGSESGDNQDLNYHFGYTIDESGIPTKIHLVYN